jgi:hypothetical protein
MPRSSSILGIIAAVQCAALLPACEVGCAPGKPQTVYAAPEERIAVRKTGRCTFEVMGTTEGRPFPHSHDGFYAVELDGFTAPLLWERYDPKTRTLTVLDQWCHDGISLVLFYQPLVHTAFP